MSHSDTASVGREPQDHDSPITSPDGQWRWDGAQWVPNQISPTQPNAGQETGPEEGGSAARASSRESSKKQPIRVWLAIAAGVLALMFAYDAVASTDSGGSAAVTGDVAATNDTDADSAVEWAYMNGVWNGAPATTRTAVCQDFRSLGPARFYEQTYLAYNPQPVHDDGRILSEGAHTRFYSQVCTRY